MTNLDKGRKHIITIFLLSSILFALFCYVLYSQNKTARFYSDDTLQSYEILRHVRLIYANVLNMETGQRGYLLTNDPEFLEPYKAARLVINREIEKLQDSALTDEQMLRMKSLETNVKAFSEALEQQMDIRKTNPDAKYYVGDFYSNKLLMDAIREDLEGVSDDQRELLSRNLHMLKTQQDNFMLTILLGTVFAIGALFIANAIIIGLLTLSKRAEDELKRSQALFADVMNGINDGVYDLDLEQSNSFVSARYKQMLGYEEHEVQNDIPSLSALIHPEDHERTMSHFQDYKDKKMPLYQNIFRMRHKNGSWVWILSRGFGIWNEEGKLIRMMGSHTDITAQKEHEEELKRLNADLESFTYLASHDLRSPLVNLKGFAGEISYQLKASEPLLQKAQKSLSDDEKTELENIFDKEIPEALEYISTAVEKMDKLTSAILDISKIGKREFKAIKVDTEQLLRNCLKSFSHAIDKEKIDIELRKLPCIVTDPIALDQVFSNILDNAIKYLSPDKRGKIVIDSFNAGYYTIFTVQDNGRGIAENDHKRVFDFFRRASNTSDVSGNGMGMAFVKTMLRKLGGNIWFESQLGGGTCFYFSLPNNKEEEN